MNHQIVIVGGGAAGISTAASLLHRDRSLNIAIIEPSEEHFYQPGWTMVGGGIFDAAVTKRSRASVWPKGVAHIKAAASAFAPESNEVILDNGQRVRYDILVVAPGLVLDWAGIAGLEDALGKNGVTSNYKFETAPYTWKLVQELNGGKAIFTQPPMPIKCAGAPQKAMYLSCSAWRKRGVLDNIDVTFCNAGPVLFGVAAYVPPLMDYVHRYGIDLAFGQTLTRVDGLAKTAWFKSTDADGNVTETAREFDMLHVTPPQKAPDFVANSPLANAAGWVDVDQVTLRHTKYANIFGVGDVMSAPNAKTAAAARKQAPIVALNVIATLAGKALPAKYDGYGSCPLTVEHGKIILAEFGYGGKLLPSFPLDSTKPRRSAWVLKKSILPWLYWNAMLKGKEWMAQPGG